jgi:RHS repeat-associated protein
MPLRGRSAATVAAASALLLFCVAASAQSTPVTTTVYVGRYFEIRDHDQPVKYVFDGDTRVAAIIGSLSTRSRVQRIRVYPGWNLISLAVTATNALGQLNSDGALPLSAAYQWDQATAGYFQVTASQTLSAGTILWVKARTNAVVSVQGAYSDPTTRHIEAGGAYTPGAGLEAWQPALPPTMSAWTYDPESKRWLDHLAAGLAFLSGRPRVLAPGQAIYLNAATQADLNVPDSSLRIRYFHQDHLGSSSVITDARGNVVQETAYYPFGVPRNQYRPRQIDEPYKFAQKERDAESGLHYFEARYLAGPLSRFISADLKYANPDALSAGELARFLSNPQHVNLYSYAWNNPLTITDPSGLDGKRRGSRPKVLVIYGGGMYEDAHHVTGMSRAAYERALKATYQREVNEAGQNAQIVVKHIETRQALKRAFKGSSYSEVIFRTHAYVDWNAGIILKMTKDEVVQVDVSAEDLARDVAGAKSAPAHLWFYGCTTANNGFAPALSKDLPNTQVTGTQKQLDMTYSWKVTGRGARYGYSVGENRDYNATYSGGKEISNAMKIDLSKSALPP